MVDVALLQKPNDEGLTHHETSVLCGMLTKGDASKEVYPLDLHADTQQCSALGFISTRAAKVLDYDYETSGLHKFIAEKLENIPQKAADVWQFKGLSVLLLYE